jgi:hypothetical protein
MTKAHAAMMLEEFLDGRIPARMSPVARRGKCQARLAARPEDFAPLRGRGEAVVELRFSLEGRSMLPDVGFPKPRGKQEPGLAGGCPPGWRIDRQRNALRREGQG